MEEGYRLACLQTNCMKPVAKLISSEHQAARVKKRYVLDPKNWTLFERF